MQTAELKSLRRLWPSLLSYGALAAFIAYLIYWYCSNRDSLVHALHLDWRYLGILIPAVAVSIWLIGLLNQVTASQLGAHLTHRRWTALAFASTLANFVLPARAGTALRAAYLRRQCNLSLTHFASTMLACQLLTSMVNATLGLLALAWYWFDAELVSGALFTAFGAVLLISLVLLLLANTNSFSGAPQTRLRRAWLDLQDGCRVLRRTPGLTVRLLAIAIALGLLYALRLYVAFLAIGHPVSLIGCVLAGALSSILQLIAVTPGGIGFSEAAIVFATAAAGITPDISLMAALIDRAVAMFVVIVLGTIGMVQISRDAATSLTSNEHK